jgi:hypothetical protein
LHNYCEPLQDPLARSCNRLREALHFDQPNELETLSGDDSCELCFRGGSRLSGRRTSLA